MKKCTLLTFFLILKYFSNAQNLIQNPDFESYSTCPTSISEVDKANFWFTTIISPDYYNCAFVSHPDFPTTSLAYSGTGFVGFLSYGDVNGSGEALGQLLNQALLPHQAYSISFAAKRPYMGMYANNCSGLEVFGFSDSVPINAGFIHASQIPNAHLLVSTLTIQDTNWTSHMINFIVPDTIKYLVFTIGQSPICMQYIFLDSINLISLKTNSIVEQNAITQFSINPNPSNGLFTISLPDDNSEIFIRDILGRVVTTSHSARGELNQYLEKSGIYFVSIKTSQGLLIRKLIIN